MTYYEHLLRDKKLGAIIDPAALHQLKQRKNITIYLCGSIMSQQLSTKVADVIYNRFLGLYNGKEPNSQQILDSSHETLRAIGLSNAKARYIKNVAQFDLDHGLQFRKLNKMSDDELIDYLTQIKGVGRWTVEMLMMSALGREDVFALDDLGIQNAMIHLYKLKREDKKLFRQKMTKIAERWRPYRTYACIHLWRWKDNPPIKTVAK